MQSSDARPSRALPLYSMILLLPAACGGRGDADGSGGDAFGGEIEFRGELPLLPGLELDSGWFPEGEAVGVRTTVTANGGVTVLANATTDGEQLTPVPGSGSLALEGGLALAVSARIDLPALSYEDVVQSFDYAIAAEQIAFEPFAIGEPVMLSSTLPAAELGSVPVPGAPGATLVFSVTGGELTTSFAGTCAQAADGFGQYAGALTMGGTLTAAATIEIDIPFVLTESYGPFELDIPIPPITTDVDLGTRSLATGEAAEPMGVCDGASADTGSPSSNASGSDGDATDSGAEASSSDPDGSSGNDGTTLADDTEGESSSDDGSQPSDEDPDYPSPLDGKCPVGTLAIGIEIGVDNGVCIPTCGGDGSCPSGATGSAIGSCSFNPDSTYNDCAGDIDCVDTGVAGEVCMGGFCSLQSSHCLLGCDATYVCPDSMTCEQGVCLYVAG